MWVLVQHKNKQEIIMVNIMAMMAGGILYRQNIFWYFWCCTAINTEKSQHKIKLTKQDNNNKVLCYVCYFSCQNYIILSRTCKDYVLFHQVDKQTIVAKGIYLDQF